MDKEKFDKARANPKVMNRIEKLWRRASGKAKPLHGRINKFAHRSPGELTDEQASQVEAMMRIGSSVSYTARKLGLTRSFVQGVFTRRKELLCQPALEFTDFNEAQRHWKTEHSTYKEGLGVPNEAP